MTRYLLSLALLACPLAGQTQTVTIDRVTRHVGAGTGMVLSTHSDAAACLAAVSASAPNGRHMCKIEITRSTPVVTPPAPPASTPQPPAPPPATGPTVYVSDCQTGAAPGCVPGNDAAPGTQAQPKRTLAGLNLNGLPAGARVLLNRGGAWLVSSLGLENPNVTLAAPLVIDAYGTGPAPLLRTTDGGNGINIGGRWGNTSYDGGYTLRNLKLDGGTAGAWGIWLVQRVRGVTLENVEITNYNIGLHSSAEESGAVNVDGLTIRGSKIHRNRAMGLLGSFKNSTIEGNTFEANNASGSNGNHAIYGSHLTGVAIRGNTFNLNSVVNGTCLGGNVTVHGVVDGLIIEGNTIRQASAAPSCYGFAVTSGYSSVESFRNVVIRGNTIIGIPFAAIAANAAPGILVEGNRIFGAGTSAITIPANGGPDADDARDADAIVRNNTLCGGGTVSVNVPGGQVSGNAVRTGADASTGVCAP